MFRSTTSSAASVKSLLIVAALAAACAHPAPPLPGPAPPDRIVLAIVTWNLHAGRGDLPRLVDDLASGRLTGAPTPHYVLLLQEVIVTDGDVSAVTGRQQLSSFFAPVRTTRDGRASGNAIISSEALRDTSIVPLPSARQMRAAAVGSIDVDGEPLFVTCVHLENRISLWRGALFSDSARGRQAEALLRALPAGHGIAGGDFNTWLGPNEPAWRSFEERFADTPRDPPQPTFRDRLVLDHLFFDLPPGWTATRRVIAERYGSDHHPVLGVVTREP